jgi:hypothetical protein
MGTSGDDFELKRISEGAIPHAIEKAERYRLLNDPEQAESICRDVLAVDDDQPDAVRILVLAITDQLVRGHHGGVREARELIKRLSDPYERAYYTGIVVERDARAHLERRGARGSYHGFREAMHWFEEAEKLRPAGNDDALLRWNSCVRTITREHLEPDPDEHELPLE